MDTFLREQDEVGSLGIVFFCNEFVRVLDTYRNTTQRGSDLSSLCDDAITALHALHRQPVAAVVQSSGLLRSPDDLATLASSVERHFGAKSTEDALKALDRIEKNIGRLKSQKELTSDLREKINEVLAFFECLAEEGLATCRRQASGDITEAERLWQHYAMS